MDYEVKLMAENKITLQPAEIEGEDWGEQNRMNKLGIVCDRIRWDEKALINAANEAKVELSLVDPKTIYLKSYEDLHELREKFGYVVIQRCVSYFRSLHDI